MGNDDCTIGAELRARVGGHDEKFHANEGEHERMWEAIDKLRNRPPVWATGVISLLTFLCGVLLKF